MCTLWFCSIIDNATKILVFMFSWYKLIDQWSFLSDVKSTVEDPNLMWNGMFGCSRLDPKTKNSLQKILFGTKYFKKGKEYKEVFMKSLRFIEKWAENFGWHFDGKCGSRTCDVELCGV